MFPEVGFVVGGLVLLALGGEVLVRGAVGMSMRLRVTPAVIGLTVVSAGTSMPELMVSVVAAFKGSADVAVGNVIGSNIFNLALVLGICALVVPLPVVRRTLRYEGPFLLLATLGTILAMRGATLNRVEGSILLAALVIFLGIMIRLARRDVKEQEEAEKRLDTGWARDTAPHLVKQTVLVVLGLGLLFGGSQLIVDGATGLARHWGISERVIGLTVVAMGTSLPELVATLAAALRGRTDLAVGNVVGSSIFNLLAILGTASVLKPFMVDSRFLQEDVWWMLGFTVLVGLLALGRRRIGRREGVLLLAAFGIYMYTLF